MTLCLRFLDQKLCQDHSVLLYNISPLDQHREYIPLVIAGSLYFQVSHGRRAATAGRSAAGRGVPGRSPDAGMNIQILVGLPIHGNIKLKIWGSKFIIQVVGHFSCGIQWSHGVPQSWNSRAEAMERYPTQCQGLVPRADWIKVQERVRLKQQPLWAFHEWERAFEVFSVTLSAWHGNWCWMYPSRCWLTDAGDPGRCGLDGEFLRLGGSVASRYFPGGNGRTLEP